MNDTRPQKCRFRLRDEGKPYPKSSCQSCGKGIFTGMGSVCATPAVAASQPAETVINTDSHQRVVRETFPILGQHGATIDLQLVKDHGSQAQSNHGQTVARLAQRGGLSWCELYAVLHNQRWQKMDENEAIIACRALEARYLAGIIK